MADPQHRQIDRSGPTKPIEDLCAPLQMIEGKSRFLEQKVPPLPQAGAGAGHRIAASCKRRSRAQFRCCTANTKPNPKAEAPSVTQAGTGAVYASLLRGKVERYEPTTHSATPVFKKHSSSPDAGWRRSRALRRCCAARWSATSGQASATSRCRRRRHRRRRQMPQPAAPVGRWLRSAAPICRASCPARRPSSRSRNRRWKQIEVPGSSVWNKNVSP